jgi:hypothetical protein
MVGIRIFARVICLASVFAALGAGAALAQREAPALAGYNAALEESSISGISSGGFMAGQFAISWSSTVRGVGIIAGGPYYCARGTAAEGLSGNLLPELIATGPCMKGPPPALDPLFQKTEEWGRGGQIDDPRHLANQHIYIFSGYNDAVVDPRVGESAYRFYRHYLGENRKGNLFYQNAIGSGHSQVTVDYGLACSDNKDYFIDRCNYDQAGVLLQHIYGTLDPKNKRDPSGKLLSFNQREFTFPESPASFSMAEIGYVYVPAACASGQPCRAHIALHGCKQNVDTIGDRYIRHGGYNEWADANRLIILYPQTVAGNPFTNFGTPLNPYGCWDWWGYTNFNYAVKAGRQITALKAMLDRLTSGYARDRPAPIPDPAIPSGILVNDVSDTGVAIAWKPVPGAQSYTVYRANGGDGNFTALGAVSGPSFGDMGLRPSTSYSYRVTATTEGQGEGPNSLVVTVTTRPIPPRCDRPGSCRIIELRCDALGAALSALLCLCREPVEQHGGRGCFRETLR